MKKFVSLLITLIMVMSLFTVPTSAATTYNLNTYSTFSGRTKEDIASRYYQALSLDPGSGNYYDVQASTRSPYNAGRLTTATHTAITGLLNYYRWLVGVNNNLPVSQHSDGLQAGALIRNFDFNHSVSSSNMPSDLDSSIYNLGAGVSHNILSYGAGPQAAITNYLNEGYMNGSFTTVGHRAMLLSYRTSGFNFGYAGTVQIGARTGTSNTTSLPFVAYPAAGYCPNEFVIPSRSAWTVELNSSQLTYTNLSDVTITVTNLNNNSSYTCTTANGKLMLDYGVLAFAQPDSNLSSYGNNSYRVDITGIKTSSGSSCTATYTVEFFKAADYVDSPIVSVKLVSGYSSIQIATTGNTDYAYAYQIIGSVLGDSIIAKCANGREVTIPLSGSWSCDTTNHKFTNSASASNLPAHVSDPNGLLRNISIPYEETYIGTLSSSSSSYVAGNNFTLNFRHYWISSNDINLYQVTGSNGNFTATLRATSSSSSYSYDSSNYTSSFSFNASGSDTGYYVFTYCGDYQHLMISLPQYIGVEAWRQMNGSWYYYTSSGTAKNWQQIDGSWYYFGSNGAMRTGWQQIDNKWYYFTGSGRMATDWCQIGSRWYYFNPSGTMVTGWKQLDNKWYYFSGNGIMQTGWQQISGKWYYFNPSGSMVTGWKQVDGKWYYFSSNGIMQTGWQQIDNKWYYFSTNGIMQTGWIQLSGKWYYLNPSGSMVTGWKQIDGKWYYFSANGIMQRDTVIDGYTLGSSGAWIR